MNWYEFNQNNSGGSFVVNDKLCHRLFIETETFSEAVLKAEELGCYWNGVAEGRDCPCCGDRWSKWGDDPVELEKFNTEGYSVGVFDGIYSNAEAEWNKRYGNFVIIEAPEWKQKYSFKEYCGKIKFRDIEEYAQFIANEYGFTVPDIRLYYDNGAVKEIFSSKLNSKG